MAGGAIRVEPVSDRAGLRRLIAVTRAIYADDPCWVQPLTFERLDHLNQAHNPFLRAIEIRYWLAYRGDRAVGRVSAQINRRHLERHRDATGHFGFLDAFDDPELFAALMGTAEGWLRDNGMHRIAGPFSLSINDESGLLVDGFDRPPSMMMGHARPYYAPRLEALGYAKAKDLLAYDIDPKAPWSPATQKLIARALAGGVRIRPLDMKRYQDEIRLICRIFNDAWADNWGFIPFGEDEAGYLAKSIRPLVDAESFAIGEIDGEAVGMTVTLPNLNEAIAGLDGRLLPFGWLRLLWRLKVRGVRSGRMPLMGIAKRLQGTPKGAALALGMIDRIHARYSALGYDHGELSWILEDNRAVQAVIAATGAVPYKRYRIYAKALA
ncbi:MAG: dATP pyrophosphohydrolase [Geminicoccaceae bacterium]